MYQTRQIKRAKNEQLDFLALESGRVYSKTVSLVRKLHRFKGFWISMVAVMAILKLKGYQLHSQSVQATIQAYFNALKSFFRVRKSNEDARPPFRTRKYFKVCWKSSAIRLKGNQLRLSNGKGREPVVLRLSKEDK
jgi:putative transposase